MLSSEEGTTYNVSRTFACEPRPESGLDCPNSPHGGVKSSSSGAWFVLALARIGRLIVQIKAIDKDDLPLI